MPRADARLLTMDEVSLAGTRACPDSLGGCCWVSWADGDIFGVPEPGVKVLAEGAEVEDASGSVVLDGCSC